MGRQITNKIITLSISRKIIREEASLSDNLRLLPTIFKFPKSNQNTDAVQSTVNRLHKSCLNSVAQTLTATRRNGHWLIRIKLCCLWLISSILSWNNMDRGLVLSGLENFVFLFRFFYFSFIYKLEGRSYVINSCYKLIVYFYILICSS